MTVRSKIAYNFGLENLFLNIKRALMKFMSSLINIIFKYYCSLQTNWIALSSNLTHFLVHKFSKSDILVIILANISVGLCIIMCRPSVKPSDSFFYSFLQFAVRLTKTMWLVKWNLYIYFVQFHRCGIAI